MVNFILVVMIFAVLAGCDKEPAKLEVPAELKGLVVDSPAAPLPDFNFKNHLGESFTKSDFEGKWSLVFFGYTSCPDVCPNTMSVLNQVTKENKTLLGESSQVVFVSVDPQRDNEKKLKSFVSFFNKDFVAATGEKQELLKFQDLGVIFDYEGDTNSDEYIVNHFAAIYMIDPKARERAYILPPHSSEQVSKAISLVYNHYK